MSVEVPSRAALVVNTNRKLWPGCLPEGLSPQDWGTIMSPVSSSVIAKPSGPPTFVASRTPVNTRSPAKPTST